MGLPEPSYSLTIPSIHDGLPLDCRIYHPTETKHNLQPQQRRQGVIIAHPYAPLGGCCDDPVVEAVVAAMLKEDLIVGTFNFRGATGSKGHTSWSCKPEISDYMSFVGLFVHYLDLLDFTGEAAWPTDHDKRIHLTLGGYSYGSLITSHLSPVESILDRFLDPSEGSAEAEVLLRAKSVSSEQNQEYARQRALKRQPSSRRHVSHSTTMGGEQSSPEKRRRSHEIRHSTDFLHSLDLPRHFHSMKRKSGEHQRREATPSQNTIGASSGSKKPSVSASYLLISPLLPPVSLALAPSAVFGMWRKKDENVSPLGKVPTLAVFGDVDMFTSVKKLREWARKMSSEPASKFQSHEISGAGHFWKESGVEKQLKDVVRNWVSEGTLERPLSPRRHT